jgi:type IV pilus assembly protein PilB
MGAGGFLTTRELVRAMSKKSGLLPKESLDATKAVAEAISRSLTSGEHVRIVNFGTFQSVKYPSRAVRNPRNPAQKILMLAHAVPKFHPSGTFKERLRAKKPSQAKTESFERIATKPLQIPYVELTRQTIPKEVLSLIPEHIARLYQAVPVARPDERTLFVAMIDPGDQVALEFIKKRTGLNIVPRLTTQADLNHVLDQYSGIQGELAEIVAAGKEEEVAPVKTQAEGAGITAEAAAAPASRIVSSLITRAVREHASDIHVEPSESGVEIRFRVDGLLRKVVTLPKEVKSAIAARVKILSSLKIDETRLPQDGRFQMIIDRGEVDFRVSFFPTVNGEKIVLRILDKSAGILTLDQLGLRGRGFDIVEDNIHKAHGMTLVTGPTGSGKTTTLYAILDRVREPKVNIITLEDPVEYRLPGVNQGAVNPDIGFTFATGLRSILRQDPNIVMIGEIRDTETAELAVHAALTGHVVLSTLHTNDAAGAAPRLIDMGVEPFLITSSLNSIVAQRLVRKICEHCKEKIALPEASLIEVKKEIDLLPPKERTERKDKPLTFFKGKGCAQCGDTGYKGRIGIFEILPVSETMKPLILEKKGSSAIQIQAVKEGMTTLKQDGVLKALDSITTLEEVFRVTKE